MKRRSRTPSRQHLRRANKARPPAGYRERMEKPSLWNRLVATAQGEVSSGTLEAYRRASLVVLELLDHVEAARAQAKLEGKTAWMLPKAKRIEMLCSWNAFVMQSLGTEFLDADYRDNPQTKGFVPPITSDQVMAFFAPVEGWLGRAKQAGADPHYTLDVPVPAPVPAWSEVEPCPNSHLHGMLQAMRSISQHARAAVDFLGETEPEDAAAARQYHAIRGLCASATAKAQYANDLHGANPSREVHELVEPSIKQAIESFHLVGQYVAMPELADRPKVAPPVVPPAPPTVPVGPRLKMPNEAGFDLWCLTDPSARRRLSADREAQIAVERLWRMDPNPQATLELHAEVQAAANRGDIGQAISAQGQPLGHFFCCPWGTVWEVRRATTIAGQSFRPYEQFVLDASVEGMELGHPFKRALKRGNFSPTHDFEYGDPSEPPDH